jgi:hypothetical protein
MRMWAKATKNIKEIKVEVADRIRLNIRSEIKLVWARNKWARKKAKAEMGRIKMKDRGANWFSPLTKL